MPFVVQKAASQGRTIETGTSRHYTDVLSRNGMLGEGFGAENQKGGILLFLWIFGGHP